MMIQSYAGGSGMRLTKALLLYEGAGRPNEGCGFEGGTVAASIHDVAPDGHNDNLPTIGPGAPLTTDVMNEIYRKLAGAQKQSRSILPANLICCEAGRLIWHLPSARRIIFFKTREKKLDDLSGKSVLHPALLFVAESRTLYVYALDSDARPNGKSKLYHAPYYNIYARGSMCAGSSRVPAGCNAKDVAAWEKLFFETNFSHTNRISSKDGQLTKHPGGHAALWQELARMRGRGVHKTFPTKYLVPEKRRLEDLLNGRL
jgi:PRTRC genetic system protein B